MYKTIIKSISYSINNDIFQDKSLLYLTFFVGCLGYFIAFSLANVFFDSASFITSSLRAHLIILSYTTYIIFSSFFIVLVLFLGLFFVRYVEDSIGFKSIGISFSKIIQKVVIIIFVHILCFSIYLLPVVGIFAVFFVNAVLFKYLFYNFLTISYYGNKDILLSPNNTVFSSWIVSFIVTGLIMVPVIQLIAPIIIIKFVLAFLKLNFIDEEVL